MGIFLHKLKLREKNEKKISKFFYQNNYRIKIRDYSLANQYIILNINHKSIRNISL